MRTGLPRFFSGLTLAAVAQVVFSPITVFAADDLDVFKKDIQPILAEHCYDCHGDGNKKGGVQLDGFANETALHDPALWMRALKNVRSGIMPPADEPRLPEDEAAKIAEWIKRGPFALDPLRPDPGRVTVRRLNRVEYRNTIRELLGVSYDTQKEFPADDTGHGFDNIGDVLTISPMLLEKYLDAAQSVVSSAVPGKAKDVAEETLLGSTFAALPVAKAVAPTQVAKTPAPTASALKFERPAPAVHDTALDLSYYTPAIVGATYHVAHAGTYRLVLDLRSVEHYVDEQFDFNHCRLVFKIDGETLLEQEFVRDEEEKFFKFSYERSWTAGDHQLTFEVKPLGPDREQNRLLRIRIASVTVQGPLDAKYWTKPKQYDRVFPRAVPRTARARRGYARELLEKFASRAFRRPVDAATTDRLVALAESVYSKPDTSFEAGIARAMVAVLDSPRFIFREEATEPLQPGRIYPLVDEYSLASRLSYFFWSSMPDQELFDLAAAGKLRANLPAQVNRMLRDPRSAEFVHNFTGQWLQARDIASVQIDASSIYLREHSDPELEAAFEAYEKINPIPEEKRTPAQVAALAHAFAVYYASQRIPKPKLTGELRWAMQQETEMSFAYLLKEDRSLLEMIECDYTFLNEDLAKHYGIAGVTGSEMRRVQLPADSPRGGILTQGTMLAVTSNPTRTSPVKRGVFILNAILGTPPAPPPPNIPALEDAASPDKIMQMTLRENLTLHAKNPMCHSCHSRMDPLGLALENFNAMGAWRDAEMKHPVEPAGTLITGESFADVRELKHILATKHRRDYYYCVTEKLLTYALGRGLDYRDTDTVDQLVAQLEATNGRPSALLNGIINSVPFQQRRPTIYLQTATANADTNPPTADRTAL
ncbi:MAG TPA: DUF1592 domain-containing protein [Lacunisphaera sp.]